MSPTVLLANDISSVGGGQTVMLDVAAMLIDADFETHVACPSGHLADRSAALGAVWHELSYTQRRMLTPRARLPRPQALAARLREGRRLAALADLIGADIVHTGALVPHLDAAAARGRLRAKVVWHINQLHPRYLFAGPLPDRVISVSNAALAPGEWRPGIRRRSAVVPNGVDLDIFRPGSVDERLRARHTLALDDRFVVMTVARLEPLKGVETLIRAAAASALQPALVVVGNADGVSDGEGHSRALHKLADELGVDARFLGNRADVPELLRAADLFAFASAWEAFGLVLAEASASGLAVVSSNVGGCPEVVVDGETGVLLDSGDIAGFARAFDLLGLDPGRRRQMGVAGRARIRDRFDKARFGQRLLPHYLALVAS